MPALRKNLGDCLCHDISKCFLSCFIFMSTGSACFSYIGLVMCRHQWPTLRLSYCPQPGFMASKSKSRRSQTHKNGKGKRKQVSRHMSFLVHVLNVSSFIYIGVLSAMSAGSKANSQSLSIVSLFLWLCNSYVERLKR